MRHKYKYKYIYSNTFLFLFIGSAVIYMITTILIISEIHIHPPSILLLTIQSIFMVITFGLAFYLFGSPLDMRYRHYYRKKKSDLKQDFKEELKNIDEFFNPEKKKDIDFDTNNLAKDHKHKGTIESHWSGNNIARCLECEEIIYLDNVQDNNKIKKIINLDFFQDVIDDIKIIRNSIIPEMTCHNLEMKWKELQKKYKK